MGLDDRYRPNTDEPRLQALWEERGVHRFDPAAGEVYAIDTPPPTVSGHLHLGHVYSYSHTDFMARFWRMRGRNVFYPMGFDENGLPTERLVERQLCATAEAIGRSVFVERCLAVGVEVEAEYEALWRRLGLSVDWRHTYRTIDDLSRRTSQLSFIDLHRKGLVYRREAPAIWCPECRTAIAQAELTDLERDAELVTLAFARPDGSALPIATTRPELLPACVAVFVHPADPRFAALVGERVRTPLFGQEVPVLADPGADPEKGTGAVMCCTFGDSTDIGWWYAHKLPLRIAVDRSGRLTEPAGEFAGLPVPEARRRIVAALEARGLVLDRRRTAQSVRAHERCDTPVEQVVTRQWFVRVLDFKRELLEAGARLIWHPPAMATRYREWVEGLRWDWCISRQRYFGVTFPVWYCDACGETILADESRLPVDPTETGPGRACACGGTSFTPERDVMDTWATSSLSPQIVGRWLADPALYARVFPMSLRPQAHEIIRTWAFYTIVKSHHHFGTLPWREVAISGWGRAAEGAAKISKSRGGGPAAPMAMLERYSADALRYWAASTGYGRDAVISEEKIGAGQKLVTKLWHVARFAARFALDEADKAKGERSQDTPPPPLSPLAVAPSPPLRPADRWILSRLQRLVRRTTALFESYDYATAKSEVEGFFWRDLADNYVELAKDRLYGGEGEGFEAARWTLRRALRTVIALFAPFLPHVAEAIYQGLFAAAEGGGSLHRSAWPQTEAALEDEAAEACGEALVAVATAVRRYKSNAGLSLGAPLAALELASADAGWRRQLDAARADILSVTRARQLRVAERLAPGLEPLASAGPVSVALGRAAPGG